MFVVFLIINLGLALAAMVNESTGTITITNNHGDVNVSLGNTITITFNDPGAGGGGGGGGGSGGSIPPDEEEEEEEEVIENLEELLSTVDPFELGFETLETSKMVAVETKEYVTTTKPDSGSLSLWPLVDGSTSEMYVDEIINDLDSGHLETLSVEHKAEVFMIETVYSNVDAKAYRTRVTITITASKDITGIKVLELVPKGVASSASSLVFASPGAPTIIEADPLFEWRVNSMSAGESKTFTYYVKGAVSDEVFYTVAVHGEYISAEIEEPTGDVIAEPESEGEPEPVRKPLTFPTLWTIIFVLVVGGLVGGYFAYKSLKQKQVTHKQRAVLMQKPEPEHIVIRPGLVIPYQKVRDVEKFIETQVRSGRNDTEIKHELLGAGWDEHALDIIMHDVHVIDNNVDKLEHFVKSCIDKGMSLSHVRGTLINVGWREDIVDLLLDDFR